MDEPTLDELVTRQFRAMVSAHKANHKVKELTLFGALFSKKVWVELLAQELMSKQKPLPQACQIV